MGLRRAVFACAVLAVWVVLAPLRAGAADADWQACAQAGAAAEQRFDIPSGLLRAIGQVESGRSGPGGLAAPWPWTIEAAGQGRYLPSREEAVAVVRELLSGGTASIDVGCFQVNLHYHPAAFASLDEAFDPVANALYAASFLTALHARDGSWEAAVAAYHSATPEHGLPYRDRVLAAWNGAAPAAPPVFAFGMRVIVPVRAGTAPGVITLHPVAGLPVLVHGRL
jgi:hypothetical protein